MYGSQAFDSATSLCAVVAAAVRVQCLGSLHTHTHTTSGWLGGVLNGIKDRIPKALHRTQLYYDIGMAWRVWNNSNHTYMKYM